MDRISQKIPSHSSTKLCEKNQEKNASRGLKEQKKYKPKQPPQGHMRQDKPTT